ncbi:MAG: hypothetical protein ACOCRK_01560 [bacterium]
MDKARQILNEVGKQLEDQSFITKMFLPSPEGYYRKFKSGEIKHYSEDEVNLIKDKAAYNDNEIILIIDGV